MHRMLLLALVTALLGGCPRPASPDTDRPPEPQALSAEVVAAIRAPGDGLPTATDRAPAPDREMQAAVDGAVGTAGAAVDARAN